MNHNPVYIGYWRRNQDGTRKPFTQEDSHLPFPEADTLTEQAVQHSLRCLDVLENHPDVKDIGYMGSSKCRICSCMNGSHEFVLEREGTQYHWPQGLRHYITEHRVALPDALWDIRVNKLAS